MYYKDLVPYCDDSSDVEGMVNCYKKVLSIGWLDASHPFSRGSVPEDVLRKLKELTLLDHKNAIDQKRGSFDSTRAVVIHSLHVRGTPYRCPFCAGDRVVALDAGASTSHENREMILGLSQMFIPAVRSGYYYSFPTLLYHYISDHGYRPPDEFLQSLCVFDSSKPFNIDDEFEDIECELIPEN